MRPRHLVRRRSFLRLALAAALLAWAAAPGAHGAEALSPAPNLLLITVDTLRPDALGWVAGPPAKTPALDALAAQGVRFPAAVTPVPITLPAHTSLLTGLLPRRHGVRDNSQVVSPDLVTLAERLRGAGYSTAAFVSGFPLDRQFGLDQGFDTYDDQLPDGSAWRKERRAPQTTRQALRWLAQAKEPWFAWVHYYDPHDPYDAPGAAPAHSFREAYEAEVAFTDRAVGELLEGSRKAAKRPVATVFTADHGESLGEHGEPTHAFFIYQSTVAVPLVVHFPQRFRPASRPEAVSLIDLTPTLLALAGQEIPKALDGVSLLPLLVGPPTLPPRALYLESQRPWRSYGWAALRAVVEGPWKLIAAPRPELYHLERDPKELRNLVDEERAQARRLAGVLRSFESTAGASGPSLEDSETQARLEALGYVGEGAGPGSEFQGADPKDRIHLWNRLHEAETALQARRFTEAAAAFEEVLKEDPKNRFALSRAGIAHLEAGKPAQAEARLRQALAIDGDHAVSRQALALALARQEKWSEAREQWQELLRIQPRNADAWVQLSVAEQKLGRSAEAKQALDRAQKLRSQQP